jgi:NADPH:quinone reductase-like Zn-dependent oxidoreductase
MKAAQIDDYGDEKAVKTVSDAPKPQPAADEVLVEVHAAGVNPFDWKVREGLTRQMAELDFPAILGGDLAGVVAELGEDVTGFEAGQTVYGQAGALSSHGSFAEYAPVKAGQLATKPSSVDYVTAASLPLAAVSAYQALVDHLQLKQGQKILIHGAAGGIGSLAVQIAKHLGAYVAGTAAAEDTDFVKELGADEVIDYRARDFTEVVKDYDAVFDTVGGETTVKSYAVLKPGGALVSMSAQADEDLASEHQVQFTSQFTRVTPERLKAVTKLTDEGVLKPNIDKTFTLDQAAEALEYQKTGHPKGKVVIKVK